MTRSPARSPAADRPELNSLASPATIAQLRRSLLDWYSRQGRDLPWRRPRDPYAIWVSEVMLQQTQVKTAAPYFQRWLVRFPDVQTLAIADRQDVLKQWQGLGYYARARNLHRAAQLVVNQHGGEFPRDFEATIALPGIGRSTAGGILSHAFDLPVAILDGNVKRVLARWTALDVPPNKALKPLWALSEAILDPGSPRDFNQALMDLGATCCTPKNPACLLCPWQDTCQSHSLGIAAERPMRETKAPLPHKHVSVAVIWNETGDRLLVDRRPAEGLFGGMWEFPGGKIEAGETPQDCVKREVQEELAIEVEVGKQLTTVDRTYTHFKVTLEVFYCRHVSGEPQTIACDEIRWVTLAELAELPFPAANVEIIEAIAAERGETISIAPQGGDAANASSGG